MDDRLQRRLRDADPLTAADGQAPSPVRLDAIKEQIMQTDERPVRAAIRPAALGLVGLAAASLAAGAGGGQPRAPDRDDARLGPGARRPSPTSRRPRPRRRCTENVVVR